MKLVKIKMSSYQYSNPKTLSFGTKDNHIDLKLWGWPIWLYNLCVYHCACYCKTIGLMPISNTGGNELEISFAVWLTSGTPLQKKSKTLLSWDPSVVFSFPFVRRGCSVSILWHSVGDQKRSKASKAWGVE